MEDRRPKVLLSEISRCRTAEVIGPPRSGMQRTSAYAHMASFEQIGGLIGQNLRSIEVRTPTESVGASQREAARPGVLYDPTAQRARHSTAETGQNYEDSVASNGRGDFGI